MTRPTDTDASKIADRLDELAGYITEGPECVRRNFHMSVPARPYEDADLVLSKAAMLIRAQASRPTDAELAELPQYVCRHDFRLDLSDCQNWDRCSTAVQCVKCGSHYSIDIALQDSAVSDVMNYRENQP
jgi:hypothetical protein